MMRACCAATTPRLGELMGSASRQELEIRQDAMTPADTAHITNLYYFLSLLTDGKALDIVQNSPANNGMEVWRRMVTRGETKVPSRHRGVLQAILFPKWDTPGAEARQLLKAWESQIATVRRRDLYSDSAGSCAQPFPRRLSSRTPTPELKNVQRIRSGWQLKYGQ